MATPRRIIATLLLEECGRMGPDYESDPEMKYLVRSSHFAAEGEIYFRCKKSKLPDLLKTMFKVEDPFMEKTGGMIPNTHTSMVSMTYKGGKYVPSGEGGKANPFLTRDPIYSEPKADTLDMVRDIGEAVLGKEAGPGIDLIGDLIGDLLNPKSRGKK